MNGDDLAASADLRKALRHLYTASSTKVSLVEVPPLGFLAVDGAGAPSANPMFQQAVEALYSLSYTLKFRVKAGLGINYPVMPLEGLWWSEDPAELGDAGAWRWTAMIAQPACITVELIAEAKNDLRKKKDLPALEKVRFETLHEGLSAQIMHVGPYETEGLTIARLHAFIAESGYAPWGRHHEIYLSDPGRTAPEKWKTILRQPVRRLEA